MGSAPVHEPALAGPALCQVAVCRLTLCGVAILGAGLFLFDGVRRLQAQPAAHRDDGEGDYLNCPLSREEYGRFYDALVHAESATLHEADEVTGSLKMPQCSHFQG